MALALRDDMRDAREQLASLTAEPVLYAAEETLAYANMGEIHLTCLSEPMGDAVIPLYTAPTAPVVPDYASFEEFWSSFEHPFAEDDELKSFAVEIWNACRTAMLHGAEPVSNRDELPLDYLQGHKDGLEWAAQLAEANHPQTGDWLYDDPIELARAIRKGPDMPTSQAGNSPVTPDGWISCSERMPDKGQRVLVCVDFDSSTVTPLVKDAEYTGSTFRIGHNTINTTGETSVTHWMPLPAPPQQ